MEARATHSLLNNSRFYILAFSVLFSIGLFAWLRITTVSDQLLSIRTQQYYGFISLLFWYVALVISPISSIIGKKRMTALLFSRRAIGVSAFYFALLHGTIALFGQLGGIEQLPFLPALFKWSLSLGACAFVILALMATTSFDRVISFMTYRKWKWLHRLVYIAGVAVLLHIWMIGTHLAYGGVQAAAFLAVTVLIGLELFSSITLLDNRFLHLIPVNKNVLFLASWATIGVLFLALPNFVQNYHSRHADHNETRQDAR